MFTDFYEAYHYLREHSMFQGNFERCLDIEVVKVNPTTKEIDDNFELNTETNVWLECGQYSKFINIHDLDLDCGGKTFEEAICTLANLVQKNYGDNYKWAEIESDSLFDVGI